MTNKHFLIHALFLVVITTVNLVNSNRNNFNPTNDWQPVLEGQQIPAGLHIRINLSTGQKEAKFLDEKIDSKKNHLSVTLDSNGNPIRTSDNGNDNNLKDRIYSTPSNSYALSQEEVDKIKSKFKTYEELRAELKTDDLSVKSDSEVMNNMFKRYDDAAIRGDSISDYTDLYVVLDDIEYLMHQIDNVWQFLYNKGIENIIVPNLLHQSNVELRKYSLKILGAIMQNNPKAQVFIFDKKVGAVLTLLLSQARSTHELSVGLYAYGSILRKFPYAQNEILKKSGLSVLLQILDNVQNDFKVKLKIIILLSDLIKEADDSRDDPRQWEQYKRIELLDALTKTEYCLIVESIIVKEKNLILSDYDFIDKMVQSCVVTHQMCHSIWSESAMLRHFLLVLKHRYQGYKELPDIELRLMYDEMMGSVETLFNGLDFVDMDTEPDLRDEL